MPHDDSSALDSVLDDFDAAWQSATPPDLEDFLPPRDGGDYEEALRGLVRIDLERRLNSGEATRLEHYLRRYPELRLDAERLTELVLFEGEVRRRIGRRPDPAEYLGRFPELADRLVEHLHTGLDVNTPASAAPGSARGPEFDLRHYVLLERVGKGGMGEVFRGRDPALDRNLAVKVLRPELRGSPDAERRFQQEARVTGALQHPNIVPVHNLGRLPDGRLYFTMKLVRGRTLADMLGEGTDVVRLPELLGVFEKVCQAVAFAHSKGVIHRDLKPANVMVGAFGEVQVMDWGLAKILQHDAGPAPETEASREDGDTVRRLRPTGSTTDDRKTGIVGTPAYMPPEQARGHTDNVDERADVFGLGAILCEVLTGRPPYSGENTVDVLSKAAGGETAEACVRLDGCGADAELVALCKRCLAGERAARPRDGGAIVEQVSAYQAGVQERLRKAELDRAAAKAREQAARAAATAERKARRRTRALAVAVLLLVVAGGGGAWWQQRQRQLADAEVAGPLDEARRLLEEGKKADSVDQLAKFDQALAAAEKADDLARTGGASEALKTRASELAKALREEQVAVERDRKLLLALLEVRGPREDLRVRTDDQRVSMMVDPNEEEQFRGAFRAWDPTFDVDTVPTQELAARLKGRPPVVRRQVIAGLDEWSVDRRARPPADWRRPAILAEALEDPDSGQRELRAMLMEATLVRLWGLGPLSVAMLSVPGPLSIGGLPVPVPFDGWLAAHRARLLRLAAETNPAQAPTLRLLSLTRALRDAGDDAVAERLLRSALLARPKDGSLYHVLGEFLESRGHWGEAVECFVAERALRPEVSGESLANALKNSNRVEEGLALYRQLVTERPDNPWLYIRYSRALVEQSRYEEAEAACRKVLELSPNLAEAFNNLGWALHGQHRNRESEDAYREAIRIKPNEPEFRNNLGVTLCDGVGRYEEAEREFRKAVEMLPGFFEAQCNLGNALYGQRHYEKAEAAYRAAIRLRPYSHTTHTYLGDTLLFLRRPKEAEESFREAIRHRPDFRPAQVILATLLTEQGRYKAALGPSREAARLRPEDPGGHYLLGTALHALGRYQESEAAFRDAIARKSDFAQAHTGLGNALLGQGRYKSAEKVYRQALQLGGDDAVAYSNLGRTLHAQGRDREAEAACRDALRLKSDFPEALCNLGQALLAQGHFAEALGSLRRGHELGNKSPGWSFPSASWVRQCERAIELDRSLPAFLRGEAEPSGRAERLDLAWLCQLPAKRLHRRAVRLASDAFAADPDAADDLQRQYRYNAARSALLTAAGEADDAQVLPDAVALMLLRLSGRDRPGARKNVLPDKEVLMQRRRAWHWLHADLVAYAKMAERDDGPAMVRQRLGHWRHDPDLLSVRDKRAIARLPEDERKAWRELWDEMDRLLLRVNEREALDQE
jgi:serine/threonine-protein kinase